MRLLKEDDTPLNNESNVNAQQTNQNLQNDAVDLTQNNQQTDQNKVENNTNNPDINWVEEYRKANATTKPLEIMKVIQRFLATLNFKGYDENKFNTFVRNNGDSLRLECNKYGLSKDNPFFIFLQQYLDYGGIIDTFIDYNKWNLLHNCVANGTLETNQLTFKSETKKQIRILFNPNLWSISPVSDIKFCIELYAELVNTNLNYFITNGYVKAAFAEDDQEAGAEEGLSKPLASADMNDPTNVVGLMKCLFMTDYIEELDKNKIRINPETRKLDASGQSKIDQVRAELNKIKTNENYDLISGKLISVDVIEHQYKILNENVQLSDTALNGQKQKKDTDDVNKYSYNNTAQKGGDANKNKINIDMQNLIKSGNNYQSLIGSIKSILSLNNKLDIADALTALSNLYKQQNNL